MDIVHLFRVFGGHGTEGPGLHDGRLITIFVWPNPAPDDGAGQIGLLFFCEFWSLEKRAKRGGQITQGFAPFLES